ncbi:Hsp33 family molecular chaperone [Ancylobacter dichloromethanicus]|uniref:33 kDa chaperonin n=1 Tax=Ancylobacter dichloromethanicus TaxID=518825 RepID=A0A9W6N1P9_9HYPH|nr:Hsp33 family molecular chaperone [Ancylobacter dichloromethanicus]MBS7553489.1 Hsp33 family molecular chaperone [Ancylobacter dichloromethanicus]GLK74410.1 33 kDa chaperonin [Ancylobacter dichloromethanicus]
MTTHSHSPSPSPDARAPDPRAVDDRITPFHIDGLDVRGRVVRLGASLDAVLAHHDYPPAVKRLLGEAVALTVLLGSTLKIEGRFILQTRTDGPVDLLVVDFSAPQDVRAYARFDAERLDAMRGALPAGAGFDSGALLGHGHLAMTIDQGLSVNRYQGVVALEGGGLEAAAHQYFTQSEQIPTRVRLAVAEEMRPGGAPSSWRAGGLMVQFLPTEGGRVRPVDLPPGDAPEGTEIPEAQEDDAWVETLSLMGTLEDVELVDAELSSERLLFRLFHERGVRVFDAGSVVAKCSCSRDRVMNVLASFTREERTSLVEDGKIAVTCEFCGRTYDFKAEEIVDVDTDGEA